MVNLFVQIVLLIIRRRDIFVTKNYLKNGRASKQILSVHIGSEKGKRVSVSVALMDRMIRTTFWPNEARALAVLKYLPDPL